MISIQLCFDGIAYWSSFSKVTQIFQGIQSLIRNLWFTTGQMVLGMYSRNYMGTLGGSNSLKNRHFCRSDTYKYDYYTSVGGTPVNFLFSQLRLLWLMKATSSQNWQEWVGIDGRDR